MTSRGRATCYLAQGFMSPLYAYGYSGRRRTSLQVLSNTQSLCIKVPQVSTSPARVTRSPATEQPRRAQLCSIHNAPGTWQAERGVEPHDYGLCVYTLLVCWGIHMTMWVLRPPPVHPSMCGIKGSSGESELARVTKSPATKPTAPL